MKRIISMLLSFILLAGLIVPCCAAEDPFDWAAWEPGEMAAQYDFANQTLDEIMAQFMARYSLSEANFSMAYYATGSGERWYFAEDVYRVAASTYKLALNMYYYDLEREGILSPDSLIEGHSLRDMHYKSIVYSDNELSMLMLYNLGEFWQYRDKMKRYCDQEYPIEYYTGNNINAGYLLSAIEYLYNHSEDYEEMLEYLLIASPGRCFKFYDSEFPIAHKYGWFATYVDPEEEAAEDSPDGEPAPASVSPESAADDTPIPDAPAEAGQADDPHSSETEPEESLTPEESEDSGATAEDGTASEPVSDEPPPEEDPKELVLKSIATNDVAIVYTPEPYLLAVLIEDLSDHEHVLGKLCELMTEYTVWQTVQTRQAQYEQEQAEQAAASQEPDEPEAPVTPAPEATVRPTITVTEHPEAEPEPETPADPEPPAEPVPAEADDPWSFLPIALIAAGVLLCILLIVILLKTRKTAKR